MKPLRIFGYCILILFFFYELFPFYWMFNTAFKTRAELRLSPHVTFFPHNPTIENFVVVLRRQVTAFVTPPIMNSIIISLVSTLTTLILSVPASYSLARFKIKRSDNISFWILSQRMMPPIALAIPYFIMIGALNLLDTQLALILVYTAFNLPFAVWMLKAYWADFPWVLEEAALTDGCNRLQSFFNVILPLSWGSIATVTFFTFIFSWYEFLFALILTRSRATTITISLASSILETGVEWGWISALSVICTIPTILLSIFLYKRIISGLTLGAIKG